LAGQVVDARAGAGADHEDFRIDAGLEQVVGDGQQGLALDAVDLVQRQDHLAVGGLQALDDGLDVLHRAVLAGEARRSREASSAWTSTRWTTTSLSSAPLQAERTMARSRRRRGVKMPGVSTSTIWVWPVMATPRTGKRVVWTFWVTIETLAPTMRLTRVDLPAFGAPMMAANPARVVFLGGGFSHCGCV
jgi:hypothetical protein